MARRRASRVLLVLGFVVGLVASFVYGFEFQRRQLPGFELLMKTYYKLKYNPVVRSVAFRATRYPTWGGWETMARRDQDRQILPREEVFARLEAIGYVGGTEPAPELKGTTLYDAEGAFNGLNLMVSGHGPEAFLVGMDGQVVHTWRMAFEQAFPEEVVPKGTWGLDYWRRCHLYPNGDLLAIFAGLGIIKVEKDLNLLWAVPNGSHHDLFVSEDGRIFVLTRKIHILPELHAWIPILEDFITVLGPDGSFIEEFSVLEAIRDSDYSSLLGAVEDSEGDILHTNTVKILDGSHEHLSPAFKAGNALVSLRTSSAVVSIDLERNRVVWAMLGPFKVQHDSSLLESGNLLLLDNLGHHGRSKVVEIDPLTQEIVWGYFWTRENDFFTPVLGATSRLPNGNTLIVESTRGRAFEVGREGNIVWEYFNPHRFGEEEAKIAVLFDVERLDESFPVSWAEGSSHDS